MIKCKVFTGQDENPESAAEEAQGAFDAWASKYPHMQPEHIVSVTATTTAVSWTVAEDLYLVEKHQYTHIITVVYADMLIRRSTTHGAVAEDL